jgi:hypothetical protein
MEGSIMIEIKGLPDTDITSVIGLKGFFVAFRRTGEVWTKTPTRDWERRPFSPDEEDAYGELLD